MYPAEFDYVAPTSLADALAILSQNEDAKVLAGGHSLVPLMKFRLARPALVVDIGRISELKGIEAENGSIVVRAMATHRDVETSDIVKSGAPAVAEAAQWVGDMQVRNRGTLCGSCSHADPASDQPGVMVALGATMHVRSASGSREIPAADFFVDTLTSALEPAEILTHISIPRIGPGEGAAYDKLGRRGGHADFAVAGAAAWVRLDGDSVADVRVGVTGVGAKTFRATSVEDALRGQAASDDAIRSAAGHAVDGVSVLEDLYGSIEYKSHLAKVFAGRALTAAVSRARGG